MQGFSIVVLKLSSELFMMNGCDDVMMWLFELADYGRYYGGNQFFPAFEMNYSHKLSPSSKKDQKMLALITFFASWDF